MPVIQAPGFNIGFNLGKHKQRSQMCEIFTDDGQIKQIELEVMKSCVDDSVHGVGYLLDADDQFMGKDKQWYQILYEKSALPVCMIAESSLKETQLSNVLDQIADESMDVAKENQYNLAKKNEWADRIVLIAAMGFSVGLIMFYFTMKGNA